MTSFPMRIRIPIHPAFLENNEEDSAENSYEKAMEKENIHEHNI